MSSTYTLLYATKCVKVSEFSETNLWKCITHSTILDRHPIRTLFYL